MGTEENGSLYWKLAVLDVYSIGNIRIIGSKNQQPWQYHHQVYIGWISQNLI